MPLTKRPVLHLRLSPLEIIVEVIASVGILLSVFVLFYYWSDLPESIPRHFNAAGVVDAWGGKGWLLTLPTVSIALYVGMTVVNCFLQTVNSPCTLTQEDVERRHRCVRLLLSALKTEIVWYFLYIEWRTIQIALREAEGLGPASLPVLLIGITGTIGVYFWQARRSR